MVDEGGAQHETPRQSHSVRPISWHNHEEEVHQEPCRKGSPEDDGGVVSGVSVVAAPGESFLPEGEVLGDSEDGERETSLKAGLVTFTHLTRPTPGEPLVEVNVSVVVP